MTFVAGTFFFFILLYACASHHPDHSCSIKIRRTYYSYQLLNELKRQRSVCWSCRLPYCWWPQSTDMLVCSRFSFSLGCLKIQGIKFMKKTKKEIIFHLPKVKLVNTRIEVDRSNLIQLPCAFPVFMWSHAGFGGNQCSHSTPDGPGLWWNRDSLVRGCFLQYHLAHLLQTLEIV